MTNIKKPRYIRGTQDIDKKDTQTNGSKKNKIHNDVFLLHYYSQLFLQKPRIKIERGSGPLFEGRGAYVGPTSHLHQSPSPSPSFLLHPRIL